MVYSQIDTISSEKLVCRDTGAYRGEMVQSDSERIGRGPSGILLLLLSGGSSLKTSQYLA